MATELRLKVILPKEFREAANFFPKAGAAVLNRTAKECRTMIAREVPIEWNVKASEVRDKIRIQNASSNNLTAKIIISAKNFPVIQFIKNPKPTLHRESVIAEVKKGRRTQLLTRTFIQTAKGKLGVFQREGKEREPFKFRKNISAFLISNSSSLREKLNQFATERIKAELPRVIKAFQLTGRE